MIGRIVKIKTLKMIISEWSIVSGSVWDNMYLAVDFNDIQVENHKIEANEPKKDKQDSVRMSAVARR